MAIGLGFALALACSDDGGGENDGAAATGTSGGIDIGTTSGAPADSGDDSGDAATAADDTAGGTAGGAGAGGCGGEVYACSDGEDNDDDGLLDSDDPECTGACDDDEGSFQTGIPGDNMDCKQDCFFDGNSGQGDDGCDWNLRCDPENPGENIGCEYTGGNNCENIPEQTPGCIDFCAGLVPNGCDCFGCCTIQTPEGDVHVYLGSGPDCSLANLEACSSCTPSTDCGNDCVPEDCEVCFGQTEPDPGCDEPECPEGQIPCVSDGEGGSTCPDGLFCLTGCCVDYDPES